MTIETLEEFNKVFAAFKKSGGTFKHGVTPLPLDGPNPKMRLRTYLDMDARRTVVTDRIESGAMDRAKVMNEKDYLASILYRCGLVQDPRG